LTNALQSAGTCPLHRAFHRPTPQEF